MLAFCSTFPHAQASMPPAQLAPAPARPPQHALSSAMDYASLLARIKHGGITFTSVISLEEISNEAELKEAFADLGIVNMSDSDYRHYLYQISFLLEELNDTRRLWRPRNHAAHGEGLHLNHVTFRRKVAGCSFSQRISELRNAGKFNDSFYLEFYSRIIADPTMLDQASYPDATKATRAQKIDHLIFILAGIKQDNTGSSTRRVLDAKLGISASQREFYSSNGQSGEWYQELRFKLFALYQRYPLLSKEQQRELIGYLLHGGAHCNDAKWQAITSAFKRFCPEDARVLDEERGGEKSGTNLQSLLRSSLAKLRIDALTNYINSHIDKRRRHSEYCSVFNATWDKLAPKLGLTPIGSIYDMADHAALMHFDAFYKQFTPALLHKTVAPEVREFLRKNYFGPFMQLVPDVDALVEKALRFYEYLY
jgi:hypothetical protein